MECLEMVSLDSQPVKSHHNNETGIYLTEILSKSNEIKKADDNGEYHLILSRCLLGDAFISPQP